MTLQSFNGSSTASQTKFGKQNTCEIMIKIMKIINRTQRSLRKQSKDYDFVFIFIDQFLQPNHLFLNYQFWTYMSSNNNSQGVIFLASILTKMAQMFSEINSIYLNVLMDRSSVEMTPQFNVNTLFHELQKKKQSQSLDFSELDDILSSQEDVPTEQLQTKSKKNINKQKQKQDKERLVPAPRPPPSSYLLFFNDHRQKIAQQFPNLSVSQLSKIGSKCWKELTPQEKKPYHDRFNQEKSKYYQALKAYNLVKKSSKFQSTNSTAKQKKKKSKQKVKKQKSEKGKDNSDLQSSLTL